MLHLEHRDHLLLQVAILVEADLALQGVQLGLGDRIAHVHNRDAVPGNINLSVGNGQVDFARGLNALADAGYPGHFALELETRDITNDERPQATARAAQLISGLI